MSCIRLHHLSSVATGVVVSQVLQSKSGCGVGFIVVHMMQHMMFWLLGCGIVCSTQVDTTLNASHNENFVQQATDTMNARKVIASGLTFPYMLLVQLLGGVCEAAVLLLPYSSSDAYIIVAILWKLSSVRYRYFVLLLVIATIIRLPIPHGYNVLRGFCLVVSFVCRHIDKQGVTLHTLILYAIVFTCNSSKCSSMWATLSPVSLMSYAISVQLHPVIMLTVVLLACLV